MSDELHIKQSIMAKLRCCGVAVSRLQLSITQDRVEVSGTVDTFYALQMIQSQLRSILGTKKLIQNVLVAVPSENSHSQRMGRRELYELGLDA